MDLVYLDVKMNSCCMVKDQRSYSVSEDVACRENDIAITLRSPGISTFHGFNESITEGDEDGEVTDKERGTDLQIESTVVGWNAILDMIRQLTSIRPTNTVSWPPPRKM
jgi:hypothetical protein